MIFLSKGLQGERGLRGPTGEKGEPVRGGQQGKVTDEVSWGAKLGLPGMAAEWKMGRGLLLQFAAPGPSDRGFYTPLGSKEAHLCEP